MDVLGNVMTQLRTQGHIYGRLELTGPFGLHFPHEAGHFIIVTRGSCFLTLPRHAPIALVAGDFIFLPTSKVFSLSSSADRREPQPFSPEQVTAFMRDRVIQIGNGTGIPVSVITGCFTFSSPESHLFVEHLPDSLHMPAANQPASPWTASILQLIASEVAQGQQGSSAVIDRLAEVLFIHAIRHHFGQACPKKHPSWLKALTDPQISKALSKMHDDLGHTWTVDELAATAGMSRSGFAARFRLLVGKTPLDHLTQWRMVRAGTLLRDPQSRKLDEIAAQVGYESESSFRKAFRKVMGTSPREYRQSAESTSSSVSP